MKIQYNSRHNRVDAVEGDLKLSAYAQAFWAVQHGREIPFENLCSFVQGNLYVQ